MPIMTRRKAIAIALGAPAALALPQAAVAATTYRVIIQGGAFHPAELQLKPGDKVIFTNNGGSHTATALDDSFDTGTLKKDQSAEVVFSTTGSFPYRCRFHRSMQGSITVG